MTTCTAAAEFLTGLEKEGFLGLAYLFVGQERHTVRHQVRTRLADAVAQHLDEHKYPFRVYAGTVVVDPLGKSSASLLRVLLLTRRTEHI